MALPFKLYLQFYYGQPWGISTMFHLVCPLKVLMVSNVFLSLFSKASTAKLWSDIAALWEKKAKDIEGVTRVRSHKFHLIHNSFSSPSPTPQLLTLVRLKMARSPVHTSASSTTTRHSRVLVPTWWSSDLTGAPATVRINSLVGEKIPLHKTSHSHSIFLGKKEEKQS